MGAKDSPNGTSRVHSSANVSPPASQGPGVSAPGEVRSRSSSEEPGVHAPALPAWRAMTLSLPPPATLGPSHRAWWGMGWLQTSLRGREPSRHSIAAGSAVQSGSDLLRPLGGFVLTVGGVRPHSSFSGPQ